MGTQTRSSWRVVAVVGISLLATSAPCTTVAAELYAHWRQLAPPAREGAAVVFDPVRDRLLVLGGFTGAGVPAETDVWSLSSTQGASWQQLHPSGVSPPSGPWQAVYDPVRDRVLVIDYWDYDAGEVTVWALTLSGRLGWERLLPLGVAPGRRFSGSAAYDPIGDRLLLFGGAEPVRATPYNTTRYLDELWSLTLGPPPTWSRLNPKGPGPSAREGAAMAVDVAGGRGILFGGGGDSTHPRDTWSLDLRGPLEWSLIDSSAGAPRGRVGHSMIIDTSRQRLILFGGVVEWVAGPPEAWQLPLRGTPRWTLLEIPGAPGEQASQQAAVLDPTRNRMVVYGGRYLANWSCPASVDGEHLRG